MLAADDIRRRIEWLIPRGNVGDTLTYLTPPWPEEYVERWGGFGRDGMRLSPNARGFVDEFARELTAVSAELREMAYGEYPEYSPAVQLRVLPSCNTDIQICYVVPKIVDVAFGAAMRRSRDLGVPIESVFPVFQKEHEIALRAMSRFGVYYIAHHDPMLFERCEWYLIYCKNIPLETATACIGEIIFFDSFYDPDQPIRF